jgi:hypothetical protein
MDKLFEKEELLLRDIKKFQKILKKEVDKNDYPDIEVLHITEDDMLHKYIKLVASNKLKKIEIIEMAKEIEIVKELMDKFGRWYA